MSEFEKLVERCFIELVDKRADAKGWTKSEFSRRIWPQSNPNCAFSKWSAMRGKASNTGKPQGALISDAQRMAEALGEDLAYLLAIAKENARLKQAQE